MSAGKLEKLARMANQIGDFYAALPDGEAAAQAASHLRAYWTPKMIRELVGFVEGGRAGLNPTAAHAVEALRRVRPALTLGPMSRWRLPDFTRMLVGQHIVNGLSVGAGVLAIAIAASAIFGFAAGQPVTLGAISASISDLPSPWREKARTLAFGFSLALISTSAIQLALPWPPVALATIGAVAFVAGMITGWGRWAIALGMQALIPVVFVLGFPPRELRHRLQDRTPVRRRRPRLYRFAVLATIVTDAQRATARRQRDDPRAVDVPATPSPRCSIRRRTSSRLTDRRSASRLRYRSSSSRRGRFCSTTPGPGRKAVRLAATIGVLLDAFDALVAAQSDVTRVRAAPPSTPFSATSARRCGSARSTSSI